MHRWTLTKEDGGCGGRRKRRREEHKNKREGLATYLLLSEPVHIFRQIEEKPPKQLVGC